MTGPEGLMGMAVLWSFSEKPPNALTLNLPYLCWVLVVVYFKSTYTSVWFFSVIHQAKLKTV